VQALALRGGRTKVHETLFELRQLFGNSPIAQEIDFLVRKIDRGLDVAAKGDETFNQCVHPL